MLMPLLGCVQGTRGRILCHDSGVNVQDLRRVLPLLSVLETRADPDVSEERSLPTAATSV